MITRDNYQEYFLLYVDNELSMADRLVVEQWVAENPDLKDEWETLLSCRIDPDATVVFQDRDSLLRSVDGIDEGNYTDYFLSYIDSELKPGEQAMVEEYLRQHPSRMIELEQLRQTVSHPDRMVVFPDKDLLYKKEKDRRVIFFYRTLAGAAAVLLAVATLLLLQGRHTGAGAGTPPVAKALPSAPVKNPVKKEEPAVTPAPTAALYPTEARNAAAVKKEKKTKEEPPAAQAVANKQESQPAELATITVPQNNNTIAAEVKKPEEPVVKTNDAVAVVQTVNIPKEQSSFATQALMAEDNEKDIIMTASEPAQPGKSKLRGLFRKVARTLGKTADRDSEGKREVLINAFQVAVN